MCECADGASVTDSHKSGPSPKVREVVTCCICGVVHVLTHFLSIDLFKIRKRWIPNVVETRSCIHKRINKEVSEQNMYIVYIG